MEIDAEVRRQTAVAFFAVGVFLASLIGIGIAFDGADGLPNEGALALIGALVGFILLMAVLGFVLSRANEAAPDEVAPDESTASTSVDAESVHADGNGETADK